MKKEIIDWYSERHYEPHKMFSVGTSWGYTREQVEAAMEHCYNKIVNEGKVIHNIDVARYVKNVCKDVDVSVKSIELKELYESNRKWKEGKQIMLAFFAGNILFNILLWLFFLNWRVV